MHPRNIYTSPINYTQLAEKYPEMKPYFKVGLNGKLKFDYKDPGGVSVLTRVLLHRDFGLDVHMPPCKLVPTMGLRMNYQLWIEDLVKFCGVDDPEVAGIDIGTGASAIFALLSAKNGWKMLATEASESSCKIADENISNNRLGHLITLKHVQNSSLVLKGVVDETKIYHFSMCNPPFFGIDELPTQRTGHRKPPNNGPTGSPEELTTEGGEAEFVSKIIKDSILLRDKIQIYTTMLGRKSSVKVCRAQLEEAKVKSYVVNVFQQGRTTRWGLAWSYCLILPTTGFWKEKKISDETPVSLTVMGHSDITEVSAKLKDVFEDLQLKIFKLESSPNTWHVTAERLMWVGKRKRRRENERLARQAEQNEDGPSEKKLKLENDHDLKIKLENDGLSCSTTASSVNNSLVILEFKAEVLEPTLVQTWCSVQMSFVSGVAGKQTLYDLREYLKKMFSGN